MTRCSIVPPHLLRRLAESGDDAAARTLVVDDRVRGRRRERLVAGVVAPALAAVAGPAWRVHTAAGGTELPGEPVRTAGEPETGEPGVDEAAAGLVASLALLEEVYGRESYDGAGATVLATVHYGTDYANAFWDGAQLVFGDGDGVVFERFTRGLDVVGHELWHAVTEHTAALRYEGQSGALNESVSDVFASCVKQRLLGQSAAEGDWLIGAEIFAAGVQARGLRDLAAPGTAYDDPRLGVDPQPAHLDDLVVTDDDNGGVHLNSGIPNRAFHLAATGIGGTSFDGAGRIWWEVLSGGQLAPDADFAAFARATVAAAGDHAAVVREAWRTVGVQPGRRVRVRRSGGITGRAVEAEVDLDDAAPGGLDELVARAVHAGVRAPGRAVPDAFSYDFDLDGTRLRAPEAALTPELRRIADVVLGQAQGPGQALS